jgi:hypothetical protein
MRAQVSSDYVLCISVFIVYFRAQAIIMLFHGTGCAILKTINPSAGQEIRCVLRNYIRYRSSKNLTWDPILNQLNKLPALIIYFLRFILLQGLSVLYTSYKC